MVLQADIMYKSNWQASTLKGMYPSTRNDSGKMEPLMIAIAVRAIPSAAVGASRYNVT